jgi:hypothetical protein
MITLCPKYWLINSSFRELAEVEEKDIRFVKLYLDENNALRIGFSFYSERQPNSYALRLPYRDRWQVTRLYSQRPRLKDVARSKSADARRFLIKKSPRRPAEWEVHFGETANAEQRKWLLFKKGAGSRRDSAGFYLSVLPSSCLRFSSDFARESGLFKRHCVSFIQPDQATNRYRLRFFFHDNRARRDCFKLNVRKRGGKINAKTYTRSLYTALGLERIASLPDELRRFEIRRLEDAGQWAWEVTLAPTFKERVTKVSAIPGDIEGIYRYLDGSEIVYIGSGRIRERARDPQRQQWRYDAIEYSPVSSRDEQRRWERFWLKVHERQHGQLPRQNTVMPPVG